MYFLIGLLIFNMLVLGANFCFLIIGGTPFTKGDEQSMVKKGDKSYTVETFVVAVSVTVLGVSWLAAWFYFLITGWGSFLKFFHSLLPHVALQFIVGVMLVLSGIAIFKKWKRNKGLLLISMVLLVFSVAIAILIYGPEGHGTAEFMYLFAMWTVVIGGVFTAATHFLDRLVHEWDEKFESER